MYQHQDQLLAATGEAEARHFWFRGFRRFLTPVLERAVAQHVGTSGPQHVGTSGPQHLGTSALQHLGSSRIRILDCGCGTGGNVEWLARHGRVSGIDYTFSGIAAGARLGRRRLAQATAAALPFADATFDLVTSFDMLQVLPEEIERRAIAEMARVLTPGGALVVNVAAMPMLRGDHALLSEETRRYTRAELGAKLATAGLVVEWISHTNATLFPLMFVTRAFQRWRGARAGTSDISVPAAPINTALAGLLALESVVVSRVPLPVGSSIVCLARKAPAAHLTRLRV